MSAVTQRHWHAMGTNCHVLIHSHHVAPDVNRPDPLSAVVALVADMEARWSRFLPTSELSRINERSGQQVTVSDLTVFAVRRALAARECTGGRFDPTILPSLRTAGYDRDFAQMSARSGARAAVEDTPKMAGAEVVVDVDAGTVRVERGAAIDLGGIAKGLAADMAATAVIGSDGVRGSCVNLGGDLRGHGEPPTAAGWGIAIDDPTDAGTTLATVAFAAGGAATSSTRRRRWRSGSHEVHHIIDPHTGVSADDGIWSVTVLATSAERAEVLATAAIVGGPEDGRRLLSDAGVPALLVEEHHHHLIGAFTEYVR